MVMNQATDDMVLRALNAMNGFTATHLDFWHPTAIDEMRYILNHALGWGDE